MGNLWTWLVNAFKTTTAPVFSIQAIDSNDKKLSLMEWDNIWEPGLPLAATEPFTQGDKQQLLWGYPGVLWASEVPADFTRLLMGPNLGKVLIKTDWGESL